MVPLPTATYDTWAVFVCCYWGLLKFSFLVYEEFCLLPDGLCCSQDLCKEKPTPSVRPNGQSKMNSLALSLDLYHLPLAFLYTNVTQAWNTLKKKHLLTETLSPNANWKWVFRLHQTFSSWSLSPCFETFICTTVTGDFSCHPDTNSPIYYWAAIHPHYCPSQSLYPLDSTRYVITSKQQLLFNHHHHHHHQLYTLLKILVNLLYSLFLWYIPRNGMGTFGLKTK